MQDGIHCPRALPPLCGDIWAAISAGAVGMDASIVRGFLYMSPKSMQQPPPEELPSGEARIRWEKTYRPHCEAAYSRIAGTAFSGMPAAGIARAFQSAMPEVVAAFGDTLRSAGELGPDAERVSVFLESRFPADGALLAASILHGNDTETASLGRDVAALAVAAGGTPDVAGMFARRDFASAAAANVEPWRSALHAFQSEHADEIAIWSEVHQPAWNEDPIPLMRLVAASIGATGHDPGARAATALAEARSRLAPDSLPEFEEALALSRDYVPIIEDRARWQLKLTGVLRRPLMALARKLVDAGTLGATDDVFMLHIEELEAAAAGTGDVRQRIEQRGAEWRENLQLTPPSTLGIPVPWEAIGQVSSMARRMFGAVAIAAPTATTVSGIGASPGVVTGRARIVRGLEEADDLQEGDILVCPSTSPPWTPYFAVVRGIVTNSGGVLSHAAIEAREYGIPAVVGTLRATDLIPDGATVTLDGAAGTVTIL
jgi:pyruvate,water dikinase